LRGFGVENQTGGNHADSGIGLRRRGEGRMWFGTPTNNKVGYFYLAK
jgi:hypothetical protein